MYDPTKDREEMMRKIVAAQMVVPEMAAPGMETMTAPAMDIGTVVPPPPTFNQSPVIDQILANLAQNYAGSDPITPARMGPVQRGGGMMPLTAPPMAAYGQGVMNITQDDDKKGLLNRLFEKFKSEGEASA